MKYRSPLRMNSALVLGFCLELMGCARAPSEAPSAAPVTVTVSHPLEQDVTDYADFTARIAAVDSVEVRSHVWGYLEKVNFKEGTLVKKGDVLFELDPRSYQADYDRAVANLAQAKAHLARREADFQRAQTLIQSAAIAKADYDLALGDRNEAAAMVGVAEAALNTARLNLGYTKVTAPVSGRVSRYLVTVGNLIQSADLANVSLLTTIVSVDPMYAYFDVDEHTVQRVRQWLRRGKAESAADTGLPVALGLAIEEGFPHQGTINFVDNQVNPKTGTLRVRGVFPNKDEVLSAGFFARVRVPTGPPHKALLVSDRALDTDQGQKVVYVVNDKKEVVSRPIRVGSLHDGLRAIEDGLKPGELVIVNGLQQVRPGVTVEPKLVEMPASVVGGRESGGRKQGGPTRVAEAMP
jgi:RND family efflux transporter MFP subunit